MAGIRVRTPDYDEAAQLCAQVYFPHRLTVLHDRARFAMSLSAVNLARRGGARSGWTARPSHRGQTLDAQRDRRPAARRRTSVPGPGFDATRDAITATLLVMLQNDEVRSRALADPVRTIPKVTEEAPRRDAPHRGLFRITTRDVELGGTALPKGAMPLLLFGAANRDESVFPDPDAVDVDRPNVREHLAFGRGLHVCPGRAAGPCRDPGGAGNPAGTASRATIGRRLRTGLRRRLLLPGPGIPARHSVNGDNER